MFDPIGYAAPIILQGKIIQREVINSQSKSNEEPGWDEPLSSEYIPKWEQWKETLSSIGKLSFPRSYFTASFPPVVKRELHTFTDASVDALGYVIYTRYSNGKEIQCSFVCAGSRVAPRAASSIPRLELCAAVEGSLASVEASRELGVPLEDCHYHTDSQIVLGYIQNTSRRFSRYVLW